MRTHFRITQAGLIALLVQIVGLTVAVVPQWAGEKEAIIAAGTAVLTAVFLLVNAIHAGIDVVKQVMVIKAPVVDDVKSELGDLIQQILDGKIAESKADFDPAVREIVKSEIAFTPLPIPTDAIRRAVEEELVKQPKPDVEAEVKQAVAALPQPDVGAEVRSQLREILGQSQ